VQIRRKKSTEQFFIPKTFVCIKYAWPIRRNQSRPGSG